MHIVGPGGSISAISHSRDDTERIGAGSQAWLTTIAGNRPCDTSRRKGAALTDTLSPMSRNTKYPWLTRIPYQVLSIRVSDGTYQDHNFVANYAWVRAALDSGRMTFGIVYTDVRPNWSDAADTVRSMIDAGGGLHPRVALISTSNRAATRLATGRAGSTICIGTMLTAPDLPRESLSTPTSLTSATGGARVPPACASSGRAMGRIRPCPRWPATRPGHFAVTHWHEPGQR